MNPGNIMLSKNISMFFFLVVQPAFGIVQPAAFQWFFPQTSQMQICASPTHAQIII